MPNVPEQFCKTSSFTRSQPTMIVKLYISWLGSNKMIYNFQLWKTYMPCKTSIASWDAYMSFHMCTRQLIARAGDVYALACMCSACALCW